MKKPNQTWERKRQNLKLTLDEKTLEALNEMGGPGARSALIDRLVAEAYKEFQSKGGSR